jgi:carbohydrate diacid regulator
MANGQFERVAALIADQTAEIFSTRVAALDERGVVIASNDPALVGRPFGAERPAGDEVYLRVPIRVDTQAAEVIVAQPANGEVISPRLARALIDSMVTQAAVVARLPNRRELKDKFIHNLLCGATGDEGAVLREAQILGLDLMRPRAVILIDAAAHILPPPGSGARPPFDDTRVRQRADLIIASVVGYFDLPNDTICAYIGGGEVAVLKASSTQDLEAWTDRADGLEQVIPSWANLTALKRAVNGLLARLRRDTLAPITIGIGRYHPGLRGLGRSYQDARAALSLGSRFHGPNEVHCLDALGVASFVGVSDEGTKVDLASHLLSPLDHEPELLETLSVFFAEDCCVSPTAARLAIHRNTLSYRLDKITSLTGLDPRHFDHAVQICLALVVRSLPHSV